MIRTRTRRRKSTRADRGERDRHEHALLERLQDGDRDAEAELLRRYLPLTALVARRHGHDASTRDELRQAGAEGLLEALRRFDRTQGASLTTYAVWWIERRVRDAARDLRQLVRIPEYLDQRYRRLRRRPPQVREDLEEAARELGLRPSHLTSFRELGHGVLSLDQGAPRNLAVRHDAGGSSWSTRSAEEVVVARWERQALRRALQALEPRHARIVSDRFGLGATGPRSRVRIGSDLGISGERVRQLERRALAALRNSLAPWEPPPAA